MKLEVEFDKARSVREHNFSPDIHDDIERLENEFLSPYGRLSSETPGRIRPEEACSIRTAFQIDRDRIVFSNAFRRLKHKTQVFLSPMGDMYRTRLTHTLEVAQIARTIARAMHLNEDLTEAIALGHDLGHTPFGHSGETALKEIYSAGFAHNEQSLRVVDVIENRGRGLNLTYAVRDGILKHSKGFGNIIPDDPNEQPFTMEGKIVRFADIMAYLNHDLEDALRSGVIREYQIPKHCVRIMGKTHAERATGMIRDLVYSSGPEDGELKLNMSDDMCEAMISMRQFLYDNVYRSSQVHAEFVKAKRVITELYNFFINDGKMLDRELIKMEMDGCKTAEQPIERTVCDFIASMTDRYALELYSNIFFPSPMV